MWLLFSSFNHMGCIMLSSNLSAQSAVLKIFYGRCAQIFGDLFVFVSVVLFVTINIIAVLK